MTSLAFPHGGSPRKPIPAAASQPSAGQIPEGGRSPARVTAARAASRPVAPRPTILTWAESAPCTCPEHCERDHDDE
jgi:hypothetical protein